MLKSSVILVFLLSFSNFACLKAYCEENSSSLQTFNTTYLDDLHRLVDESQSNIKELNQQVKEVSVTKKSKQREDEANAYYKKGLDLTEQGNFSEAREYFDKAIHVTEREDTTRNIKVGKERLKIQEAALKKAKREFDSEKLKKQENIGQNRKQVEEVDKKQQERKALEEQKQKILKEKQQRIEENRQQKKEQLVKIKEEKFKRQEDLRKKSDSNKLLLKQRREELEKQKVFEQQRKQEDQEHKNQEKLAVIKDKQEGQQKLQEERKRNLEQQQKLEENKKIKGFDRQKILEQEKQTVVEKDREQKTILKQKKETEPQQKEVQLAKAKEDRNKRQVFFRTDREAKGYIVDSDYETAIDFYKEKKFNESKLKFEAVNKELPGYKATDSYLRKIDRAIADKQKREEKEKQKILEQQRNKEEETKKIQKAHQKWVETQKTTTLETKQKEVPYQESNSNLPSSKKQQTEEPQLAKANEEEIKRQVFLHADKEAKEYIADSDYKTALDFYKEKKFNESKLKFEAVNKELPGYKATDSYLRKINKAIGNKPKQEISHQAMNPNLASSKEQRAEEAQLLNDLAKKSSKLYRDITYLADDNNTVIAKRKLAKVDQVISNLKQEKEKELIQMRENEQRQHQQELRNKEQLRMQEAEKNYNEALSLVSSRNFDNAKLKFLEVESILPNFKSTHKYLSHLDEDQRKAQEDAIEERTLEEKRKFQEKKDKERLEKEKQRNEKIAQQKNHLAQIAKKAANINDEILKMTNERNYLGAKGKFDELEETMLELKKIKDSIAAQKEYNQLAESQAKEQKQYNQEIHKVFEEKRLKKNQQNINPDIRKFQKKDLREDVSFKNKEETRQRNVIFDQGIELYRVKEYAKAKIIFSELASKGDAGARVYLRKIEHLTEEKTVTLVKKDVGYDRSYYLADKLQQLRIKEKLDIQDQERQRKLSRELERQKQHSEEADQVDRRRMETLKYQEKNRQIFEESRHHLENKNKAQEEEYRFRKLKPDYRKKQNQLQNNIQLDKNSRELEKERKVVRKQLEVGVAIMYTEAVKLYKSRNYQAAFNRFSDIQVLIPDYKNINDYLKKTNNHIQMAPPLPSISNENLSTSVVFHKLQKTSNLREDQISKTLDLFDSNLK